MSEVINAARADVQRLEPGVLINLFELDLTSRGGEVLRFHAHQHGGLIKWQGQQYHAFPVQIMGFGRTGDAAQPTPTLSVANLDGAISRLCERFADLVGAPVRRRRTLAQYLDDSAQADPHAEMPVEVWLIEQKTLETAAVVEFSLSSPLDLSGRKLPARQIISAVCQWEYRGAECGYRGTDYFTRNNIKTKKPEEDMCGGRLSCCRKRFKDVPLPFGGFPAAGADGALTRGG
ncbi:phage minor tail protein L [Caballeronia sp. LZ001]|uniref:phage minor tail protein L n=1 Tax=Caballeronia sp. LZ001 TaxID=3038553 RepID=UPI002862CEFA|nr:phage minor tail protein L [Caballeronia sp. LZ001]MDR5800632.1 phage minor tail protein L [Caballeronia sp. LZ001]